MRLPARLLLPLLWLLLALPAAAGSFDRGLLWRIEQGGRVGHLFGTMHSGDPRVTRLPEPVRRALEGSERLVLEVLPDQALLAAGLAMLYTDGRDLEQVADRETFARAAKLLAARGYPAEAVRLFKPWAVVVLLSMPQQSDPALDLVLYREALERGLETGALESAEEQIAVFDRLPPADQLALLRDTLDQAETLPELLERLTGAYLAGDLAALAALSGAHQGPDAALNRRLEERLILERNRRMAERLGRQLAEGRAFIAVGALHLPGEEGLLRLLERRGYRVTRVY